MKTLVEFRRNGRSAKAKKALWAAFKCNDHVLKLLQSDEPPRMPESYALGSPEEAAICLQELQTVWEETGGFLEWMFQEYVLWERDRTKRIREQKRKNKKKVKRKWRRSNAPRELDSYALSQRSARRSIAGGSRKPMKRHGTRREQD